MTPTPSSDSTKHSEEKEDLLNKIDRSGPSLEECLNIFVGLQTSADRIYLVEILDEGTDDELVKVKSQNGNTYTLEKELLKPFLKGKDVSRYEPLEPRYWVIFPYHFEEGNAEFVDEEQLKSKYPRTYEYLREHEDDLRGRENGKMDHERWYDYVYPKNLTKFRKEKILTPEISYGSNFTYDSGGLYHTTKVYGLLKNENIEVSEEYLLAVMNSPVLWFFLSNTGYTLRGGYFTFKTQYLNPFSVPSISFDSSKRERKKQTQEYIDGIEDFTDIEISRTIPETQDVAHDLLSELVNYIIEFKDSYSKLNLSLLDHLRVSRLDDGIVERCEGFDPAIY
ncbi:TaqI-like C-terminal specificity domain-containing protein [Halorubrum rubrum]|uniref:TaqI-like C-terminal specificity domain-containing protein n=1 Tax=Halorubrum rubrum TaxID=1126240 RepID=UPI00211285F1|nr:TaqI-like C-terminal specificity domain-containing protein [Halorubrum rubrum]